MRREAHEALDPSCVAPTVQASEGSVQQQNEISGIFEHLVHHSMDFYFPD